MAEANSAFEDPSFWQKVAVRLQAQPGQTQGAQGVLPNDQQQDRAVNPTGTGALAPAGGAVSPSQSSLASAPGATAEATPVVAADTGSQALAPQVPAQQAGGSAQMNPLGLAMALLHQFAPNVPAPTGANPGANGFGFGNATFGGGSSGSQAPGQAGAPGANTMGSYINGQYIPSPNPSYTPGGYYGASYPGTVYHQGIGPGAQGGYSGDQWGGSGLPGANGANGGNFVGTPGGFSGRVGGFNIGDYF